MKDYNEYLKERFSGLKIHLVKHDDSPNGMPCTIVVDLGSSLKDKGQLVLDLSNYLYRMGLKFQTCPEFIGRGKKSQLRFYMTWKDVKFIKPNICQATGTKDLGADWLPLAFRSLIIQDQSRGVTPSLSE